MTAILVVAIIVLLIGAISGATMSAIGKERKSIESHKKILSVMEDLASSTTESKSQAKSADSEASRSHVRAVRPVGQRYSGNGKGKTTYSGDSLSVGAKGHGRVIGLHGDRFFVDEGEDDPKTLQIPIVDLTRTVGLDASDIDDLEELSRDEELRDSRLAASPIIIEDSPEPGDDDPQLGMTPLHASRTSQMKIGSVVIAVGIGVIGVSAVVFNVATTTHTTRASNSSPSTSNSPVSASKKKAKKSVSTTTTVPNQISPLTSNATGSTYQVPVGSLTIQLTASAPCWVEQSNRPYGKLFFAQTIAAGQTQTLNSTAPLWISTGNVKALSIKINNVPVVISAPSGTYNFTFNPS